MATKANRRDAEHRIGFGAFGAVKYGMDYIGNFYAVKIEKTNTAAQEKESQVSLDIGLMSQQKITRVSALGKDKYYSSLLYLGESLDKKLRYGPSLSNPLISGHAKNQSKTLVFGVNYQNFASDCLVLLE